MALRDLLRGVPDLAAAEARRFVAEHREGEYTLLDVRQPKEYAQAHIPGSKLVPLPQISDRLAEIPPELPTIVYCAIGGRSSVAARYLASKGFREVYNLKGGIRAWQGETVSGPVDRHLPFLEAHPTIERLTALAQSMEAGLGRLYQGLAARTPDGDVKQLLAELAGWEDAHQKTVAELAAAQGVAESGPTAEAGAAVIEGGFDGEAFLADNAALLDSRRGILELAMMIEAYALDLYLRFSQEVTDEPSRRLLRGVADEEKLHLSRLAGLLDQTA